MDQPIFSGVCTALVTPFLEDKVNYAMLERLLDRQICAGINAIVLCGTTGEAPTLSDREKLEIFERGKKFVGDSCKIIAGTGSNATTHAVSLSKSAQSAGADALLVVSPYYNKAMPEGLIAHYGAIADAVSLPLILYNVPTRTCVDIPVSVYKCLADHPNVVGVKEASQNITKVTKIRAACPDGFSVWSGNDDQTVPVISLGGRGVISVLSNILPGHMQAMANAALTNDYETAAYMQQLLQPLAELMFCEINPIPVKAALKHLGLDCGPCRLPLSPISPDNLQRIIKHL